MSVGPSNLFADSHDAEQNIIDQAKEINKEVKKNKQKPKQILIQKLAMKNHCL